MQIVMIVFHPHIVTVPLFSNKMQLVNVSVAETSKSQPKDLQKYAEVSHAVLSYFYIYIEYLTRLIWNQLETMRSLLSLVLLNY